VKLALTRIALVFAGLTFMLLLGEALARLYFLSIHQIPFFSTRSLTPRHYFGWQGHQTIGDLATTRPRILVVGDSMTHGLGWAQDADMYYATLGRLLNVEVFAYGAPGFGTLQEYLVIDRYVPLVKPDLVLLQTSFNDFINNTWELESASFLNNNLTSRPYLENGRLRYRFPSRYVDYTPLMGHSRLAHILALRVARVFAALSMKGWPYSVERSLHPTFKPLQRSIATTEQIIAMLKTSLGTIPLVAFAADGPDPYWRAILERQGVPFYEGVPPAITAEERRLGTSIRPDGAHWDSRGHRVVGELLAQWIFGQPFPGSPMRVSSPPPSDVGSVADHVRIEGRRP
jgi:lysophospholipase L1-like esterase